MYNRYTYGHSIHTVVMFVGGTYWVFTSPYFLSKIALSDDSVYESSILSLPGTSPSLWGWCLRWSCWHQHRCVLMKLDLERSRGYVCCSVLHVHGGVGIKPTISIFSSPLHYFGILHHKFVYRDCVIVTYSKVPCKPTLCIRPYHTQCSITPAYLITAIAV